MAGLAPEFWSLMGYLLQGVVVETSLVANSQTYNTIKRESELIVEAEMGGKGTKEYLVRFSKEILQTLNPKMPLKNIKQERYRERDSPDIAEHIEINRETLGRNASLKHLGKLLTRCQHSET